ncbi:hypothetical protein CULT_2050005 [[Clostridium] ultunense Esp]|nr:hypothetical protein CULT_2050005 [[Clostridium] ultunense Esp]
MILAIVGGFVGLYWLFFYDELVKRAGNHTLLDRIHGKCLGKSTF